VTRPFNYTGPRQGPHFLIPKLVRHFANKASDIELGNIDVEREFNDVRMVCEVYRILLDKGVAGEAYNVCSGRAYSLKHVMAVLSEITNHEMKININPALVRMNEVLRLCGSTQKLNATIGEIPLFDLKQTLLWMLKQQ
jgi:nucleoside-diphosphate-sugar epimerase